MAETNLNQLIKGMLPQLNEGNYVFVTLTDLSQIPLESVISHFKEAEGYTLILEQKIADVHKLSYDYIASWITLKVHSSLHAVGLTAAFSTALAKNNISCNVVAAYYHDHIFVNKKDALKAMKVLKHLSEKA